MSEHSELELRLAEILSKYGKREDTNEVQFELFSPSRSWRWRWAETTAPRQCFIASITKLFVTAIVMQLRNEGLIELDAPAGTYLDASVMDRIHVYKGVDFGARITVRELLSHTSGIADYFEQRRRDGTTQIGRALREDFEWSFDDVLRITREELSPRSAPSTPRKAFYSDTNFQLLSRIIESVSSASFEHVLQQRILSPLELHETYLFTRDTVDRYTSVASLLYGRQKVRIPLAMASVRADGGIVSTTSDCLTFLHAFMSGKLFPAEYLEEMQRDWNTVFHPIEYGLGLMRFALPRYYTLGRRVPPMTGHSGASGAVLYHVKELDLYLCGTVNQIKKRSMSYNVMSRLVMACQSAWTAPN